MNSYYQSLLKEVQNLMDEFSFQNAYDLIHQELAMPYVPREVEDVLESYEETCKEHLNQKISSNHMDDITYLVQGSMAQKEFAESLLIRQNLREYLPEVQSLLDSELFDEYKGELIEALIEQKVDDPLHVEKSGMAITFVPSSIVRKQDDLTLQKTQKILDSWLSNYNPSFYNFCIRLLDQEILEMRPFDFEGIDAIALAKSIVYLVMEAFGQTEEFVTFEKGWGLQDIERIPLLIERRKEDNE